MKSPDYRYVAHRGVGLAPWSQVNRTPLKPYRVVGRILVWGSILGFSLMCWGFLFYACGRGL